MHEAINDINRLGNVINIPFASAKENCFKIVSFWYCETSKPSQVHPKCKLITVKLLEDSPIHSYAWIDSCEFYFIDLMYGPGQSAIIYRRNKDGQRAVQCSLYCTTIYRWEQNRARRTSYFCSVCYFGFHPDCLVAWHNAHSLDYRHLN